MSVSDDDLRPRYVQIADALRREIETGTFKPGERITPARGLANEYGVAVLTAQKAVDLLKEQGLLVGVAGRGTYVQADGTDDTTAEPSPEYTQIMEHIEHLRSTMRDQMKLIDQRMSDLESLVQAAQQDQPPSNSGDQSQP